MMSISAANTDTDTATIHSGLLGYAYQGSNIYVSSTLTINLLQTYQWFVDGKPVDAGTSRTIYAGDTLLPGEDYVGKDVYVVVSGFDQSGVRTTVTSNVMPVLNTNDVPQGTLVVDPGAQLPGNLLHATSTVTDADGLGALSYQWKANGQAIAGATGASWTMTQAQSGKTISVAASYVDGHGHTESVASDMAQQTTGTDPGSLSIVGTLAAGHTINAVVTDADGIDGIHYQWQASTTGSVWTDLAGATGSSISFGDAIPALLRLRLDYTDNYGGLASFSRTLGTEGADHIATAESLATIQAGGGDDTIDYAGAGSLVDGGAGIDTYVMPYAQYFAGVSQVAPHVWRTHNMLGSSSTIRDVERVRFNDVSIALDTDGVAGQAFRLYQAAFNRAPDKVGAGFWIYQLDKGMALTEVASAFVQSAEFTSLYGDHPGNAALVTSLYQNILHRAPEAGGYQFWVDVLDRHAVSVADVLVNFSDSPENVATLVGALSKGVEYTPYG